MTADPSFDPKAFWNAKILGWEASRYGGASPGLVEGLAGRASSSLRFRLDVAARLLAPHLAGRRVVELGCGSGLLAERLLTLGAASYQGYDISDAAIGRGGATAPRSPLREAMRFAVAAVADAAAPGRRRDRVARPGRLARRGRTRPSVRARPPRIVLSRRLGTAPHGGAARPSRLCPTVLRVEERRLRAALPRDGGDRRHRRSTRDRPAERLSPPTPALRRLRQRPAAGMAVTRAPGTPPAAAPSPATAAPPPWPAPTVRRARREWRSAASRRNRSATPGSARPAA